MLIHEATFQEGLEVDALIKKHTITSQAIEIAKLAGAWRLVLTHFSPRYQKVTELSDKEMDPHTLISFDHMRVSFSQLEWAPEVVKIYRALLSNEDVYTEMEESKNEESKDNKFDKRKISIEKLERSY